MQTSKLARLANTYARHDPAELGGVLRARLARTPRCSVTLYLLGCQCWDRGRVAEAVRYFMLAHHAEAELQSAALLVFAGLSWVTRRNEELLPVLLDTWEEFRRPDFDRCHKECILLDAFAEDQPGLERVSPLARRLWRLPLKTLRAQLRQVILSSDAAQYPLLILPA
ncbi:MAG: hypothetical protein JXO22_12190 [Phycisphaerae bacterium]|nr:hypothetical protein [Phycisphaerae bacterium]